MKSFDISFTSEAGVVSLGGRVDDFGQWVEAERLANETEGAREVVNKIKVGKA
jgi:osmotically-inducible protein OsmY